MVIFIDSNEKARQICDRISHQCYYYLYNQQALGILFMNTLVGKISKLEKNSYVKTISLIALVLGAFITIGTFGKNVTDFAYKKFFTTRILSKEMMKLSAGQDIDYFRKALGPQILQREVNKYLLEFVFYYKGAYIQTLVNKKDNSVIYWAITDCSKELVIDRPAFYNYADRLILNKTTFNNFFGNEKGDLEIFISGATSNSYAYESLYLGNPSSYQTVIVGANDICGYFGGNVELSGSYPEDIAGLKQREVGNFRYETVINTYAESAPFAGNDVIKLLNDNRSEGKPYLNFGVDRV